MLVMRLRELRASVCARQCMWKEEYACERATVVSRQAEGAWKELQIMRRAGEREGVRRKRQGKEEIESEEPDEDEPSIGIKRFRYD